MTKTFSSGRYFQSVLFVRHFSVTHFFCSLVFQRYSRFQYGFQCRNFTVIVYQKRENPFTFDLDCECTNSTVTSNIDSLAYNFGYSNSKLTSRFNVTKYGRGLSRVISSFRIGPVYNSSWLTKIGFKGSVVRTVLYRRIFSICQERFGLSSYISLFILIENR